MTEKEIDQKLPTTNTEELDNTQRDFMNSIENLPRKRSPIYKYFSLIQEVVLYQETEICVWKALSILGRFIGMFAIFTIAELGRIAVLGYLLWCLYHLGAYDVEFIANLPRDILTLIIGYLVTDKFANYVYGGLNGKEASAYMKYIGNVWDTLESKNKVEQ